MQNWRVGPVQTVSGGSFWGSGFVLYDETGKPCVTFGYFSESYAKAGREHIVAALANAASVIGVVHRDHLGALRPVSKFGSY